MNRFAAALTVTLLVWETLPDVVVTGFVPQSWTVSTTYHRTTTTTTLTPHSEQNGSTNSRTLLRVVQSSTLMIEDAVNHSPLLLSPRSKQSSSSSSSPKAPQPQQNLGGINMPKGLRESLETNSQVFHKHIWIVDNSGSMVLEDGHHAIPTTTAGSSSDCDKESSTSDCTTRWGELRETVNCHAKLAEALGCPTDFKFLNPLRSNNKKRATDRSQTTIRVGYNNHHHHHHRFPFGRRNKSRPSGDGNSQQTKRMESTLARTKPSGMTPLPQCINQVREEVQSLLPQLIAEGTKVSVVIATDGCNYNLEDIKSGDCRLMSEEERNGELVQALASLQELPVQVVIRLCTDYEPLVDFYNSLDERQDWNLQIDILDDHKSEAKQVQAHQPWLNYALLLHRMREMGHYHPLLDRLDERPLTPPEIRQFLQLLFGEEHFAARPPPPNAAAAYEEWAIDFLNEVIDIQESEQSESCYWKNPRTNCKEPWIDIERLAFALLDDVILKDDSSSDDALAP